MQFGNRSGQFGSLRVAACALAVPALLSLCQVSEAAARGRRTAARPAGQPAARVALRSVPLPDGSGSMRLPVGWQITSASNGMVSAAGPHGLADLGIWVVVHTPQAAAQWVTRPPLVAPYGDPWQAVQQVVPQLLGLGKPGGGPRFRWLRLIDRAPAAAPQGKGEFLHFEWELPGKGRFQSVALVMMMPTGDGTWIFYSSSITSPSAQFARNLPVLQQIWASWKVSDHVYQQRLTNALASMRETGRILRSINSGRQEAQDRSNTAWSHVRRGTWQYEDTQTGERYETSHDTLRQRIEAMNRNAGYERYREVPYRDLNR